MHAGKTLSFSIYNSNIHIIYDILFLFEIDRMHSKIFLLAILYNLNNENKRSRVFILFVTCYADTNYGLTYYLHVA